MEEKKGNLTKYKEKLEEFNNKDFYSMDLPELFDTMTVFLNLMWNVFCSLEKHKFYMGKLSPYRTLCKNIFGYSVLGLHRAPAASSTVGKILADIASHKSSNKIVPIKTLSAETGGHCGLLLADTIAALEAIQLQVKNYHKNVAESKKRLSGSDSGRDVCLSIMLQIIASVVPKLNACSSVVKQLLAIDAGSKTGMPEINEITSQNLFDKSESCAGLNVDSAVLASACSRLPIVNLNNAGQLAQFVFLNFLKLAPDVRGDLVGSASTFEPFRNSVKSGKFRLNQYVYFGGISTITLDKKPFPLAALASLPVHGLITACVKMFKIKKLLLTLGVSQGRLVKAGKPISISVGGLSYWKALTEVEKSGATVGGILADKGLLKSLHCYTSSRR